MASITFTSDGGITATDTISAPSFIENNTNINTKYVKHRSQDSAPFVSYNDLCSLYNGGTNMPYYRITLPVVASWCMMTLEFTIRQSYSDGKAGKLFVYGNYSSGNQWNTFRASTSGTLSGISVYGSDQKYIYIGGISSWGGATLDKMTMGDSITSYDCSAVTFDYVTSLPSTYQTATMGSYVTGSMTASSFNATSARDKKENIEKTKIKALELLNTVEVVDFNFKDDKDKVPKVGFIADDTDSILATPEHNQMDVTNCVGVLIKAVQELTDKNNLLEKRIKELEERLNG